jgi:hypothetical protein
VGGGVTDPALACFSFPPLGAAAAALAAPSSSAAASFTRVIDAIVGRIRESKDAGTGCCLESHICGSFGLGKSMGSREGCRVSFKHKLANLLVDELRNKLLNQGEVVVDLLARVRAVVEVAETGMTSSDILRQNLFPDVVIGPGVHASSGRHELLLVPRDEILPGGDLDGRVGRQVGDVDGDDVGCVSGCLLSHRRSGLPDPTDVGPHIDFTHFQIVSFPRHPFHQISGAESLQPGGTSSLRQDCSCPSNVRLRLAGCNDLGKSVGPNNYLGGRGMGSSRNDWRDKGRCIRRTTSVGGCVGGSIPLGLDPGLFYGSGVHTD